MVSVIRLLLLWRWISNLRGSQRPNRRRAGPSRYSYFGLELSVMVRFRVGGRIRRLNTGNFVFNFRCRGADYGNDRKYLMGVCDCTLGLCSGSDRCGGSGRMVIYKNNFGFGEYLLGVIIFIAIVICLPIVLRWVDDREASALKKPPSSVGTLVPKTLFTSSSPKSATRST